MSNETKEIRGQVPVAVAERIEHAAQVLGTAASKIVAQAVENGLGETLDYMARIRAAELATFMQPKPANGDRQSEAAKLHASPPSDLPSRRKPVSAERKEEIAFEEARQRQRLEAQNRDQRTAADKMPRTRGTGR